MSEKICFVKMDQQGRAIGYLHDKIFFVPKCLPGEEGIVEVLKEKKNFGEAKLSELTKISDQRVTPFCPYFDSCGGCDLEHMSYESSVLWKQETLLDLMNRSGLKIPPVTFESSENPMFYRNKISLKVHQGKLGFYEGSTHDFLPILECMITKKSINAVLKDFSFFKYQEGELVIRANYNDELLIEIRSEDEINILNDLTTHHKIAGIVINGKCVYGNPYFFERTNGVLYQVSYDSFFQINEPVSKMLFDDVKKLVKESHHVLDLYCGVGTMGLQVINSVESVTGIEIVPNAILNAIKNATLNNAKNTNYHLGDVGKLITQIPFDFDTVIIDPPRTGLDEKTKNVLKEMNPEKIIYVSCNPQTLIRDLKEMDELYCISIVKGYDMFPFTKHIECLCEMNRR